MSELGDIYKQNRNSIRSERQSNFETNILPLIKCDVYIGKNGQFIFDSNLGVIDYFPKSKRLLIRAKNKWIHNGDNWIKENLL
jgi:hypothetical protein